MARHEFHTSMIRNHSALMPRLLGSALLLFLTASSLICTAQRTGEIQLYVNPAMTMRYILNGAERMNAAVLVLPEGDHRFTFWAPDRRIVDTVLHVVADSVVMFRKTLPPSAEFLAHQAELRQIGSQRLGWRGLPLLATAAGGVFTVVAWSKHNEAYDALETAEASYADLRAPNTIRGLKNDELPRLKSEFDASRTRLLVAGLATGVAAVATIYGFKRTANLKAKPYEDKEKLKFEGLVYVPGQQGGWFTTLSLAIR